MYISTFLNFCYGFVLSRIISPDLPESINNSSPMVPGCQTEVPLRYHCLYLYTKQCFGPLRLDVWCVL